MEHKRDPDLEDAGHSSETAEDDGAAANVGPPDKQAPKASGGQHSTPTWLAVVLVVLALGLGFLLGRPAQPLDTSADAGFLRDMSSHHAQAVDMSMIILDKAEDPQLHNVATDMARTQQAQIGMMQGWLTEWDLPSRGSEPPMTWMADADHDHGDEDDDIPETMPGLATPEEMDELEEAEGQAAEVMFLELMIEHHLGGIEMAEAQVELGSEDQVTNLAQGMVDAQQNEVDLMEGMLEQRGDEPDDGSDNDSENASDDDQDS